MKIKTIDKIITNKINEWLDSIEGETLSGKSLKELVRDNCIVTGGCIASMLLNQEVNDFDVYFTNINIAKQLSDYYINIFNTTNKVLGSSFVEKDRLILTFPTYEDRKEKGLKTEDFHELGDTIVIKDDNKKDYRPIFISENAITLSSGIQLIVRFYGNAEEIHKNYDFIHCTNYWTYDKGLIINQQALESIIAKDLMYIGSLYPLASLIRIRKFINRGWTINAGQIVKMAYQVSKLDLNDVAVLKDQLIGVDLAYFAELLEAIMSIPINTKLNYGYLSRIIDKIF